MLIAALILLSLTLGMEEGGSPTLYQVPGKDLYMEFSNERTKRLVEDDFRKFDYLGKYHPQRIENLDPKDRFFGTRVTQ